MNAPATLISRHADFQAALDQAIVTTAILCRDYPNTAPAVLPLRVRKRHGRWALWTCRGEIP